MPSGTGAVVGSFTLAGTGINISPTAGAGQTFHNFGRADLSKWTAPAQFKIALFYSGLGFTPSLTTALYSSLTGELPSADGYGLTGLAFNGALNPVIIETEASAWSQAWTLGTTYAVGQVVNGGASGFLYQCISPGMAASNPPTQTVIGALDSSSTGALFICVGTSITVYTSAAAQWTAVGGSLGPADFAIIYDTVSLYNAVEINLLTQQTALPTLQLTITPDPVYGWAYAIPR
jgi:hypothetical protein